MASRRSNLPVCVRVFPVDCYFSQAVFRDTTRRRDYLSSVFSLYRARAREKQSTAEGEEGAFAFKVAHFCIKKDCRKPEQEVSWL